MKNTIIPLPRMLKCLYVASKPMPPLPSVPFTNNLDYQNRKLATISATASMTGTASRLQFHLVATMNTGLTETQMKDFISVRAGGDVACLIPLFLP
jgi:alkylhydroperoxidase/carboxymuconolactone decarboxylase family protein YurZ